MDLAEVGKRKHYILPSETGSNMSQHYRSLMCVVDGVQHRKKSALTSTKQHLESFKSTYLFVVAKIYSPTLRWITLVEQKVFPIATDLETMNSLWIDCLVLINFAEFWHCTYIVPFCTYCTGPLEFTWDSKHPEKRSDCCGSSQSRNISQVRTLWLRLHGANWEGWRSCMVGITARPAITSIEEQHHKILYRNW